MKRALAVGVLVLALSVTFGCTSAQHRRRVRASREAAAGSSAVAAPSTHSEESGPKVVPEDSGRWQVVLAPYLWALSLDGDITVRGVTQSVDLNFGDILEHFNFGGNVRLEAKRGDWTLLFDEMFARLGDDITKGPVSVDVDMTMAITELAVLRRIYGKPLFEAAPGDLSAELMAGGRWIYVKNELDFRRGLHVEKSVDWVDPFVGGRLTYKLSGKWALLVRGDVGGFGIGSSSDFTWQLQTSAAYRAWERTFLLLGYGILDIDYERGSGPSKFAMDLQMSGPHVALIHRF
ncbi:MAG: hypothetical protein ACYTFZ_05770 [Planctomycetota bacterium]|jgi:hypothetical protein